VTNRLRSSEETRLVSNNSYWPLFMSSNPKHLLQFRRTLSFVWFLYTVTMTFTSHSFGAECFHDAGGGGGGGTVYHNTQN
jgi:hypothetical protein